MSWLGGNGGARKSGIITVLDIGSSKVCCIIARLKPCAPSEVLRGRTHQIQVMGIGHQKSRGVKSGVIVDLALAEQAIRLAVDAAERLYEMTNEVEIAELREAMLQYCKLDTLAMVKIYQYLRDL